MFLENYQFPEILVYTFIMKNNQQTKMKWRLIKPWLGVIALGGAGVLPCPDCGAPMIFHFWPIALILALRN